MLYIAKKLRKKVIDYVNQYHNKKMEEVNPFEQYWGKDINYVKTELQKIYPDYKIRLIFEYEAVLEDYIEGRMNIVYDDKGIVIQIDRG